ncbi:UV DNA damage repair endonuclease UvsE [Paracoccus sp. MC1854]|uniref:UV DNA damage repair endonuclease UvsE n=1 Tax=Paracoccus sp. MC1854 TaxID=2760306 RepID=UPI00160344CC|nr:UV DNA damage repair endonuclease UvsE [Paracoccus sp. MC1854]MBB1492136.1 UV DNA damage repair endonuclease UvsE [Paracoccus sp. MC1854]
MHERPLRMGFPVKVMGRPGLKSNDTRRWRQNPHLKTSLEYVDAILDYLARTGIEMYRMSSDLAPYATHPDMPQFHDMVAESDAELAAMGRKARELDIRLSFHPSQFVLLNSPDPALTAKSIWDLSSQAEMLDRMGMGPEAVLVTHVGGVYDNREESRARWIEGYNQCPGHVRRRLVLENDDIRFSAADVLWIHDRCGVPLIFDYQHHWCLNPEGLALRTALERFIGSWPEGVRPKIHFSSPRTEMREIKRKVTDKEREAARTAGPPEGALTKGVVKATSRVKTVLLPPVWTGHADFTNPFEFATFMRDAAGLEFDVMLEAKTKDLSLLRLRSDLLRYAPDVAARFGAGTGDAARLAEAERMLGAGMEAGADIDEGEPAALSEG